MKHPAEHEGRNGSKYRRRALVAILLLVVLVLGILLACKQASSNEELFFNQYWALLFLMPFLGLGLAAITKREDPHVVGDKVLRHDNGAILAHWTHAVGCVALLISGIALGCLFIPNLLSTDATNAMMNVHFVAACFFLFGSFYYLANTLLSPYRLKEHLPDKNAIDYTVRHYGRMIGFKKFSMPPEDKYFESERMAYIGAVGLTLAIVITGIIKSLAHVGLVVPDALMAVVFFIHDLAALIMVLFVVAHVFFAVFAPGSFPLFISMLTGYLPLSIVKEDHAGWLEKLERAGRGIGADSGEAGTEKATAEDSATENAPTNKTDTTGEKEFATANEKRAAAAVAGQAQEGAI